MIADEILEILGDSADRGEGLNGLVDEFRQGRDVWEVVPLLASEDAELVSTAAWIFSELPEELYSAEEIVSRLRGLTEHIDPLVRFYAFGAIYPFLNLAEPATQALLTKLREDENAGVRMRAEAALARSSPSSNVLRMDNYRRRKDKGAT